MCAFLTLEVRCPFSLLQRLQRAFSVSGCVSIVFLFLCVLGKGHVLLASKSIEASHESCVGKPRTHGSTHQNYPLVVIVVMINVIIY